MYMYDIYLYDHVLVFLILAIFFFLSHTSTSPIYSLLCLLNFISISSPLSTTYDRMWKVYTLRENWLFLSQRLLGVPLQQVRLCDQLPAPVSSRHPPTLHACMCSFHLHPEDSVWFLYLFFSNTPSPFFHHDSRFFYLGNLNSYSAS